MTHSPENVLDRLLEFSQQIKMEKPIEGVIYREDYQDYQVLIEGNQHIELRKKLIDILMDDPKHKDTCREVKFLLNHPVEFEEWEE
ncbi:MAG: hypothetical protein ACLFPX_06160 [Candidatus Omnitrophota bacterium]